jgi:UDP-N-acetylglucosamine--N-acetylmuramyl-(pentapeptide) pyrophosphoryl-undecaprenol N-acetylglucosamine transferase
VGAEGRMEMQKVPEAGYAIKGLPIAGLQRSLDLKNLLLPIKILKSVTMAMKIISDFKPDVAIGVGGYASAPLLFAAKLKGIPYVIQEQNSYAGITNKILGKWAKKICVAYDGMQNFFPKEKIVFTGNPVRAAISGSKITKQEALKFFDLAENKKTVLVIGGSLGARTINQSMDAGIEKINAENIQLIWQTGKGYFETAKQSLVREDTNQGTNSTPRLVSSLTSIKVFDFIKQMDMAYAIAGKGSRPVESITQFAQNMGGFSTTNPGSAEILIHRTSSSPFLAALANAAASHVAEQDDVHNGSVFHPATVVFPAALTFENTG